MLRFVMGEKGKIIPLDLKTQVFEVTKDLAGFEIAKQTAANFYVSHFATCPKANDFNGGKEKMKFNSVKMPKAITIAQKFSVHVNQEGEAQFRVGFGEYTVGPRAAIVIARWLIRYARWSSLK